MRREVAEGRTVDDGVDHLGCLGGLDERGVVVAERDGRDLRVPVPVCQKECTVLCERVLGEKSNLHVQQHVAVGVRDVVAQALGIVRQHVEAARVKDLVEVLDVLLGHGAGDGRLDRWPGGLVGEDA